MAPKRPQILTLNDPMVMRINRELAIEIGLEESIVLLQLEYLIAISAHEHEGKLWTYQSLEGLREIFPWWSRATINRIIRRLKDQSLIEIGNFNKKAYDRTQWYALDINGISKLHSVAIFQNEKWTMAHRNAISQNETSISQFDHMHDLKMRNACDQIETTIPKTTSKTTTERGEGQQPDEAPAQPTPSTPDQQALSTAAADLLKVPSYMTKEHAKDLQALITFLSENGVSAEVVALFGKWWYEASWVARNAKRDGRGRPTQPTAAQVTANWPDFTTWLEREQRKASRPAQQAQDERSGGDRPLTREEIAERMRQLRSARA